MPRIFKNSINIITVRKATNYYPINLIVEAKDRKYRAIDLKLNNFDANVEIE